MTAEISRFHEMLEDLARHLDTSAALQGGATPERLPQGPFADAMTQAGQIAMLRRPFGSPVPSESFIVAEIDAGRLGPDQAAPASPNAVWPEAPAWWRAGDGRSA